jgi:hypothetical protein
VPYTGHLLSVGQGHARSYDGLDTWLRRRQELHAEFWLWNFFEAREREGTPTLRTALPPSSGLFKRSVTTQGTSTHILNPWEPRISVDNLVAKRVKWAQETGRVTTTLIRASSSLIGSAGATSINLNYLHTSQIITTSVRQQYRQLRNLINRCNVCQFTITSLYDNHFCRDTDLEFSQNFIW